MTDVQTLSNQINKQFADWIEGSTIALNELTVNVKPKHIVDICLILRDKPEFDFKLLADVCGIDYLHYGLADWETESTTETGFSRGVTSQPSLKNNGQVEGLKPVYIRENPGKPCRFAAVYHLLSLSNNHRVRLKANLPDNEPLIIDSVIDIWPSADWFEREAFDLYGIVFRNHPDLRRLLTDYGFVGHPFRKDFPLIGKVEVRYDAYLQRVIYEPVSIQPRVLEPKVIRHDNRYAVETLSVKVGPNG